jgi:hypothetical protein
MEANLDKLGNRFALGALSSVHLVSITALLAPARIQ